MALTLGDNFSYQGAKPLDARLIYSTVASMKAVADVTMYDGCMAYCTATDKTYQWKSTNAVDETTGKWREFSGGSDLPSGGTTGQALVKHSNTDDDVEWATVKGVPTGGTTGQALVKHSNTDHDVEWAEVSGDTIQVDTLPIAGADELGKVYQYIGSTTLTLTHGYFYECVSDGESTPTYSWSQVEVSKGGHDIKNNGVAVTSRDTMNFTDFDISDDSTNEETDIKTHRLTQAEIIDIVSPLPSTPIDMPIVIDETGTEYVIGWYKTSQGKVPIYEKTAVSSNSGSNVEISDFDSIAIGKVLGSNAFMLRKSDNLYRPIPSIGLYNGTFQQDSCATFFYFAANETNRLSVRVSTSLAGLFTYYVTLRYTKTTDTPV